MVAEMLCIAATAESCDKSSDSREKQSGYPWSLWKILQCSSGVVAPNAIRSLAVNGATGAPVAPVESLRLCPSLPLHLFQGGPRLYKLFLLSPWVLFRLLIYRLPLITRLRLYSFRRRDEPIAHRLDANSVPLFLRRSHTFSAAPATIIIFPLSPLRAPLILCLPLPLYTSPLHLPSARVKQAEGGKKKEDEQKRVSE